MAVMVPELGELTRGVARGDYSRGVVLSSRTWLSDGGDLELRSNIERQVVSEWEIEGSMLKRGLWIAGMDRVCEGWNSDALLWHVSESRSDVVWLLDLDTAEEEMSARIKSTIVARGATVLVSRHRCCSASSAWVSERLIASERGLWPWARMLLREKKEDES